MLRKSSNSNNSEDIKGLKVNLVRIIGNLSYKHFPTQEKIRENHGIELILSSTQIDPQNECLLN